MMRRSLPLLLLPLVTLGCDDPQDQALPFDVQPAPVTRTVPVSGGFISSPAGAAIEFPAGAFNGDQSVSLSPGALPASLGASGTPVSSHGYAVTPAGARLNVPARAELRFDAPRGDSAWLATLVSVSPLGVVEHAETRVDVAQHIASARVGTLGTLAVVIPGRDAVFPLSGPETTPPSGAPSSQAILRLMNADSLKVDCGTRGDRCAGLSIRVSDNLLGRVERAAVVYPTLNGTLRVQGGEVVGGVRVVASFRAELAEGQIAENVRIDESFQFRVRFAPDFPIPGFSRSVIAGAAEEPATLYIPETGNPMATVRHQIQLPGTSGASETAFISITFPFEVHE